MQHEQSAVKFLICFYSPYGGICIFILCCRSFSEIVQARPVSCQSVSKFLTC